MRCAARPAIMPIATWPAGFCFLNNAAIAAEHLRRQYERVAILDVDVHHGNGTQGIFYERPDILTVSIHAEPSALLPFFWGYAHERGAGPAPAPISTSRCRSAPATMAICRHSRAAAQTIKAFAPGALVVALGLDASEDDPLAGLKITTDGFRRIGTALARIGLPSVLIQEGGYLSDVLGRNLEAVLSGFESAR